MSFRPNNKTGTVYTYDGMGERVAKAGSKLYWKGVGSTALVETDTSDRNPTEYIFFNGARIARIDPGATTPKYSLTDNLGSTAVETDSLGNILNESLFFPYGVERVIEQSDTANNYKFTGKERDTETGLDDFGARYYASSLGRFMTPDWDAKPTSVPYASFGDPQTLNLYSYVENGPLNKVDADGHAASQNVANQWVIPDNYCAAMQGYGGLCGPGGANQEMLTAQLDLGGSLDARAAAADAESAVEVVWVENSNATAAAQPTDQQGKSQTDQQQSQQSDQSANGTQSSSDKTSGTDKVVGGVTEAGVAGKLARGADGAAQAAKAATRGRPAVTPSKPTIPEMRPAPGEGPTPGELAKPNGLQRAVELLGNVLGGLANMVERGVIPVVYIPPSHKLPNPPQG